jgi:hypothetical protein
MGLAKRSPATCTGTISAVYYSAAHPSDSNRAFVAAFKKVKTDCDRILSPWVATAMRQPKIKVSGLRWII